MFNWATFNTYGFKRITIVTRQSLQQENEINCTLLTSGLVGKSRLDYWLKNTFTTNTENFQACQMKFGTGE